MSDENRWQKMTEPEYRAAVRTELAPFLPDLRSELLGRLRVPPSRSETALLEFVVHEADLFRDTCPIYGWEVDVDSRCSPFGGQQHIQILRKKRLFSASLDYFSDIDFEPEDAGDIVLDEIAQWFAAAWTAAGGRDYFVPGYIMRHDDIEFFSLSQREWMSFPTDSRGRLVKEKLK